MQTVQRRSGRLHRLGRLKSMENAYGVMGLLRVWQLMPSFDSNDRESFTASVMTVSILHAYVFQMFGQSIYTTRTSAEGLIVHATRRHTWGPLLQGWGVHTPLLRLKR